MKRASALLLVLALLGASPGCRSDELVELRLYPCEFAGIEPRAVSVEITGFDEQGNVVETHEVTFDDIAATTFADGYASVGYRKHGEVVRARFRVGWFETAMAGPIAEADAIAVYDELDVPGAGEVLVLGELAADCAELIADGTEATSNESSEDADTSSDDVDTSSEDADTSSDDLDTMDTSSDDADTTDATTEDDTETTETSGDPPGPQAGDPCAIGLSFYCTGGPTPEDAGTPLFCSDVSMMLEPTDNFAGGCVGACIDGSALPVDGCGDIGAAAKCMCESLAAPNCEGEALGCVAPNQLHLCFEGKVVVGTCEGCAMSPEGWFTCE